MALLPLGGRPGRFLGAAAGGGASEAGFLVGTREFHDALENPILWRRPAPANGPGAHNRPMADHVENLVLEHLIALGNELRTFRLQTEAELGVIKQRLDRLELSVAELGVQSATISVRMDHIDASIARIERRLDSGEEPKA
jgi:hypothetical protein